MSPLRVSIIGAHGKVAKHLVHKLANLPSEFTPVALIRNPAQAEQFKEINVESKLIDLTGPVSDIAAAIKGSDAVVFSAGAAGKPPGPEVIDHQGVVKVLEALKDTGIKRFILVGALKTDNRSAWEGTALHDYYVAKKKADDAIRAAPHVEYTILRPGSLSDGPGGKKVLDLKVDDDVTNEDIRRYTIDRADVAEAAILSLRNKNTIGKVIPLLNGDGVDLKTFIEKF
ncbi:hypothetical protein DV495_002333 [Geotrichum candidum]|uniref:NAD(P)-binding domain-containing protein n=1 Tax=Geotrichum candidum TaxID=1173061 RepID=A0A0J9XGU1_GEOCN|nr:hypothetical protein DV452_003781 [Geotrichum candidum]KAI9214645.1 hypothetical protein DS838_000445 [Geotrichum bryndzae]KAF5115623.1 hypothetical protein DV454_002226 [Geotrichum candidum]KAF5129387.1 hypothetical protein DV495_002333 [Geotrichum candidum]KAF7501024.1 hypothetical protein DV113_000996 [Geotrichum candidum]